MLILRRRPGESILIGDGIEVRVIEAGPNRVKLGICAPPDVAVVRQEVALVRDQNLEAAHSLGDGRLAALLGAFSGAASEIRQPASAIPLEKSQEIFQINSENHDMKSES